MAVDWRLAGGGFDAMQSLRAYGAAAQQHAQQEQQQRQLAEQQRQLVARRAVGAQVAAGDYAGARQQAAAGGDFDLATAVNGFEDHHRAELQTRAELIGGLAAGLRGRPAAERQAAFQAVAPQLAERGFTPDQLSQVDLSDNGLDGYIAFATQAKDALSAYRASQVPVSVADGADLIRPADGALIAHNERDRPAADWVFDSESGSWLQKPGTGTAPVPGGGSPVAPAGTVSFAGLPGEHVTSTYRDPAHNRAVGGVGNSFHQFRDANGNPMARDSTPPPGMSMAAYAGALRERNPNVEVIPESDHVHMEPHGRPPARSGAPAPLASPGAPGIINVRPPKSRDDHAPAGYRFNGANLEAIPGGPADPNSTHNQQHDQQTETRLRSEFDGLPEVKSFKTARQQFQALRNIAGNTNATAQDDIAAIFSFMKTLDPNSTVREGEFATAQQAAGLPEKLVNSYNQVVQGTRLNPQQRQEMIRTAYRGYSSFRDAYNQAAQRYQRIARSSGADPVSVAQLYETAPQRSSTPTPSRSSHPADIQALLNKYGR